MTFVPRLLKKMANKIIWHIICNNNKEIKKIKTCLVDYLMI